MRIQRSIPIVLPDDTDLRATVLAAQRVQQGLSPICFNDGESLSQVALHRAAYKEFRGSLNAQMLCSCIRLVAAAYVSAKKNKRPAKRAFRFVRPRALFLIGQRGRDARFTQDGNLSIWTTAGRKRVSYRIPDAFQATFDGAIEVDALTVFIRDKRLQMRLVVTLEVPDPSGTRPVGIDLNKTNAVVAVDDQDRVFFKSGVTTRIQNAQTRKTRSRVQRKMATRKAQKKDTRSTRRLLKRLSCRQRNRVRTFCQTTAKRLVEWAGPDSVLVLENLRLPKVSKRARVRKGTRRALNQWPYALLRSCIENKAEVLGLRTEAVNPRMTSQTCSLCGEIGERWGHRFRCECGHQEHADINAAKNIRDKLTVLRSRGPLSTGPEALVS